MKRESFILFLLLTSICLLSCNDKPIENISSSNFKYEIILSGWNGKMGVEDHIVQLKSDGSFRQTVISWKDSCGKISSTDYDGLISEIDNINPLQISLYHNRSCSDADGGKFTTKLIITVKESNKTNTIRWSDCENDEANKSLIEKLNLVRDHINAVIQKAEKHLCN